MYYHKQKTQKCVHLDIPLFKLVQISFQRVRTKVEFFFKE